MPAWVGVLNCPEQEVCVCGYAYYARGKNMLGRGSSEPPPLILGLAGPSFCDVCVCVCGVQKRVVAGRYGAEE